MKKSRRRTAPKPRRLPRDLKRFFWDYDFGRMSWKADRDLVIARILAVGGWDALRWLQRRVPPDELRAWLRQRRGAGLSNRQLRFWELILKLRRSEVNDWMADPGRQVWENR